MKPEKNMNKERKRNKILAYYLFFIIRKRIRLEYS